MSDRMVFPRELNVNEKWREHETRKSSMSKRVIALLSMYQQLI